MSAAPKRKKAHYCEICKEYKYDVYRVRRLDNRNACPDCTIIELLALIQAEDGGS